MKNHELEPSALSKKKDLKINKGQKPVKKDVYNSGVPDDAERSLRPDAIEERPEEDLLDEVGLSALETQEPHKDAAVVIFQSDDPVANYLREIGQTPLLTADQEVELAKKMEMGRLASATVGEPEAESSHGTDTNAWEGMITEGAEAQRAMIQANLRLVVSIAKRYQGRGLSLMDLIQEGNLGLIRATEKFDYTKGHKFSTYATFWIRQSCGRAIFDHGRTIRLPVHLGERLGQIGRTRARLEQLLDREPTQEEIAIELGLTVDQVTRAIEAGKHPLSLEKPVNEDEGSSTLDNAVADQTVDVHEEVERGMLSSDLRQALTHLTSRERDIVNLRYGLIDGQPLTLEQVGQRYSLTRERVRQIEAEALRKLRHPHIAKALTDYLEK